MKRAVAILLSAITLLAATLTPTADAQAADLHEETFAYGAHPRQALDAYWHESSTPQAGLVLVHGGSWNGGSRNDWADTARWYADQGLAVFAIDHRFNTDVAWPGPRDDVLAAIDWIKTGAARFDLSPDKLVIMGSQAGGQLATAAGTYGAGAATVRGVIGLSTIASPYRSWGGAPFAGSPAIRRKIRDNAVILTRCHPSESDQPCWSRWADTVTKSRASADDAPMYLLAAQQDPYVSAGHASDLATALQAKGVSVTNETVAGSASGGHLLNDVTKPKTLAWIKARTAAQSPPVSAVPPASITTAQSPRSDTDGVLAATRMFPRTSTEPLVETTHAYGQHARQQLDAYYHSNAEPQPALILVHGGHWYGGDKQDWAATARWFADQGYAVFSINYRLNTDAPWPSQRDDTNSAISWIRQNAATFHVAPSRIVMLGSSAGGHLAAMAGTYAKGTDALRGVVALSPVADPNLGYTTGQTEGATASQVKLRDNATVLARCHPDPASTSCRDQWADTAAKHHATEGDTPMYLIHSQEDFVPATHSTQLCTALTQTHVSCVTETTTGNYHGGSLFKVPGLRDKILAWLKSYD